MSLFVGNGINDLFKAAQAFVEKVKPGDPQNKERDRDFGEKLEGDLAISDHSVAGATLAKTYLNLDDSIGRKLNGYKNDASKNFLRKLLETAFAFLANRNKVDLTEEKKSKITDAIYKMGEGFAQELEKYCQGAVAIFNKIKHRITEQFDLGAKDALNAFAMNPVASKEDTIYGEQQAYTALEALKNPLLDYGLEAPYSKIKPEHVVPAVEVAAARSKAQIAKILKLLDADPGQDNENMNFENTLVALSEAVAYFDEVANVLYHLEGVNIADEFRDVQDEAGDIIADFENYMANDEKITELKKRYLATDEARQLTGARKRYVEDIKLGMRLNGAELNDADKERFNELNKRMSQLARKFGSNNIDSRQDILISAEDEAKLAGLTDKDMKSLRSNANRVREKLTGEQSEAVALERIPKGSFLISGDPAIYKAVMSRLDDVSIRKKLYMMRRDKAGPNATRGLLGNGDKDAELDNTEIINEIFEIRQEKSKLLGFDSFAELATFDLMAGNPQTVMDFYDKLIVQAKPLAQKDYEDLVSFQKEIGYQNLDSDPDQVYPWDSSYLSEKLQERDYGINDAMIKPYFEYNKTLNGMLDCASKLFDIRFIEKPDADSLDVNQGGTYYDVVDNQTQQSLGSFFLDPFMRDDKEDGAGAFMIRTGYTKQDGTKVLPVVNLSCDFDKASAGNPSLLTHKQVQTLFHEFGHGLHVLLSEAELRSQFGYQTKWDFLELPSQLMENFAYDKEVIQSFAKNSEGQVIPDDLVAKLNKARKFHEGTRVYKLLGYGMLDMMLYNQANSDIASSKRPLEIYDEILGKTRFGPKLEGLDYFPNSFPHIFSLNYAAKLYGYLWSEALEADAFSEFQKGGGSVLKPEIGKRYRDTILAVGDSVDPMQAFENFTGRNTLDPGPLLERMSS